MNYWKRSLVGRVGLGPRGAESEDIRPQAGFLALLQ